MKTNSKSKIINRNDFVIKNGFRRKNTNFIFNKIIKSEWNDRMNYFESKEVIENIDEIILFDFFVDKPDIVFKDIKKEDGFPIYQPDIIFVLFAQMKIYEKYKKDDDVIIFFNQIFKEIINDWDLNYLGEIETISFNNLENKPTLSLFFSGQFRNSSWAKSIIKTVLTLKASYNIRLVIQTWDKEVKEMSWFNGMPKTNFFAQRIMALSNVDFPKVNISVKDFSEMMPKTFVFLNRDISKKITQKKILNSIKTILPYLIEKPHIIINEEKKFEEEFSFFENIKTRNHSLNQAKQFWGFYESLKFIKSHPTNFIMRVRPDSYVTNFNSNFSNLDNRIITYLSPRYGVDDKFFFGTFDNVIETYYSLSSNIINNKTFYQHSANNVRIKSDSHKLLTNQYLFTGIAAYQNTFFKISNKQQFRFSKKFKRIFFNELNNLSLENKKDILKVFNPLLNN